jgi:hypothetical protein
MGGGGAGAAGGIGDLIGGALQGPMNLLQGIGGAFKKLFGRKKKKSHKCPPRPQPFKPPCMNPSQQFQGIQNQLGQITQQLSQLVEKFGQMTGQQGAQQGGQMGIGDVVKSLQDLLGKLTGQQGGAQGASSSGGGFSAAAALGGQASGTGFSTGGSSVASEGGKIDGMMSEAKKLMSSDKKEDQLKGQEMMQNAQNMFNMLSQLIKAQGDMAKAAIQNMR